MSTDTYHDVFEKARMLSLVEQLKLIEDIAAGLRRILEDRPIQNKRVKEDQPIDQTLQEGKESPLHSIMEFEGLGKEVWEGINVEEYLNEERNSWGG